MKVLLSVPTGYNARELLIPLHHHLEQAESIQTVFVVTPAAPYRAEVFPTYSAKFQFFANPVDVVSHETLLTKLAPDVVVTPTAGLDEHDTPLLQAALKLGIPTLTFVSSWDNVYKMERFKQYGKPYALADHLAVWNPMMRDHVLRVFPEIAPDRVSIVGAPRFDFFTHHDVIPSQSALFGYLGIPDDGGKLVHLATTELYPMEYIVKTIHHAMERGDIADKLHLYASVHPGGNMARHQAYAAKYGVTVRYSFGRRDQSAAPEFLYNPTMEEIYLLVALFKYSAVLINHSSTVAIESFYANVPVINVKYGQRFDWWRWRRSMVYRDFTQHYRDITAEGATSVVTNAQELLAELKADLRNPERKAAARRRTLQKMITSTDGTAGQQLLDKIKDLAHQEL